MKLELTAENSIDLAEAKANLDQILDEIADHNIEKVIIKDGEPTAVLISLMEYEPMQERLLAIELQQTLEEVKEEYKRGEYTKLEDLAQKFGVELTNPQKPENYDELVPTTLKKYFENDS
jgi:prevent-host-death family protein